MTLRSAVTLSFLALASGACTPAADEFEDAGPGTDDAGPGMVDAGPGTVDAGGPVGRVVEDLATGNGFTCAALGDGFTYCWGRNDFGQLGMGEQSDPSDATAVPQRVIEPGDRAPLAGVTELEAQGDAVCAITGGAAYCWGNNQPRRFSDGSFDVEPFAVPMTYVGEPPSEVLEISHDNSNLCVRVAREVLCAGLNTQGQLGRTITGSSTFQLGAIEGLPFGPEPLSIAVGLSSGNGFTVVALDDGTVWCLGANDDHECGLPTTDPVMMPTQIPGLERIEQVVAGSDFACARNDVGEVFCWGSNTGGKTGDGVDGGPDVQTPRRVEGLPVVGRLAAGRDAVLAITEDGTGVWGWGENRNGMLGLGPEMDGATAPTVLLMDGTSDFDAAAAFSHACVRQRRAGMPDEILCAGSNRDLALGTTSPSAGRFSPVVGLP